MDWFSRMPADDGTLNLICFPYAGGFCSSYMQWQSALPDNIRVCPVLLPGREGNTGVQRETDFSTLLCQMVDELLPQLRYCRYALYGHSMGAWLAWRLAVAACERHMPPHALCVSGQQAPHLPYPFPRLSGTTDDALLDFFHRVSAGRAFDEDALQNMMLPLIRGDIMLCESHPSDASNTTLTCPLLAFGAYEDPLIPPDTLAAWDHEGTAGFELSLQHGGHDFIHAEAATFLPRLCAGLEAYDDVSGVL